MNLVRPLAHTNIVCARTAGGNLILRLLGVAWIASAILMSSSPAIASELQRFHKDVEAAFGHYRSAMFYLRTGNEAAGGLELEFLDQKWGTVVRNWSSAPPDAFSDDPAWQKALMSIAETISRATTALDRSDTKQSRVLLTPIRRSLYELRRRNGVRTFTDCIEEMNGQMASLWAYRSAPPDLNDPSQRNAIKAGAAVYEYLLGQCRRDAPAAYRENAEFVRLFDGAAHSVRTLWDATDRGQRQRFINILRELRPFDRLIFLRFG